MQSSRLGLELALHVFKALAEAIALDMARTLAMGALLLVSSSLRPGAALAFASLGALGRARGSISVSGRRGAPLRDEDTLRVALQAIEAGIASPVDVLKRQVVQSRLKGVLKSGLFLIYYGLFG